MNRERLAWLLRCGAAALETPGDLTEDEKSQLAEDLAAAADLVEKGARLRDGY
jgi:hypothetical protein